MFNQMAIISVAGILALWSVVVAPLAAAVEAQQASPCDPGAMTASGDSALALDARLGGSIDAFTARYGPASDQVLFLEYDVPGCGAVLVADFEGKVVTSISVFSPREDQDKSRTIPDEADWTLDEAVQIAMGFIPIDTHLLEPQTDAAGNTVIPGVSGLLAEMVPLEVYQYVDNTPAPGGLSVVFSHTPAGKVSWMTIQLQIEI